LSGLLRRVSPADLHGMPRGVLDAETLATAAAIVEDVRERGEEAVRAHAERFGDIGPADSLSIGRRELLEGFETLDEETRELLIRVHRRIEAFCRAQRDGLADLTIQIEGGQAGHRWIPVRSVGVYAPGGRYPLPSSVLMTVTPARVAGVTSVWLASPRPSPLVLGAAWVAGADGVLTVGGAQAVAALAFGTVSPRADMIVGPGNRWVVAAKRHLFGEVGIDGLAGLTEIVVVADDDADPALAAGDLLAQAEHDVDALPILITTSMRMAEEIDRELGEQLADLPTSEVAAVALENGFCVVVDSLSQATAVSDSLAPEHVALHVNEPRALAMQLREYGSLFIGPGSAEAFADYGAGPNHVLPTGGGPRYQSGLSVMTFLKASTWLAIDRPDYLVEDTARLARLEGLEGHARAALARSRQTELRQGRSPVSAAPRDASTPPPTGRPR
jgi:phosphoribosyl-ATP pyrophosphohydrolase/phosphoribosyl-AMP cyclohydrolase/histidinol dehydrogenase